MKDPLLVTSPDKLDSLIELIHDEYFCLDDISFSKDNVTVTIPYRRIFHQYPGRLIRNWLLFRTYEVDVIRASLTIRNVIDYSFVDHARIGTFSFNIMSCKDHILIVDCTPDLKLIMTISDFEIESRDIEVRGKARITQGLFWTSDTGRIYD